MTHQLMLLLLCCTPKPDLVQGGGQGLALTSNPVHRELLKIVHVQPCEESCFKSMNERMDGSDPDFAYETRLTSHRTCCTCEDECVNECMPEGLLKEIQERAYKRGITQLYTWVQISFEILRILACCLLTFLMSPKDRRCKLIGWLVDLLID